MTVERADLGVFAPVEQSDIATNGGRLTATQIPSGTIGNVFPDAGEAERTAGSTKFRKVFFKNSEDSGTGFLNTRLFVENYTPGEDEITIFSGTETDQQGDLTGSERRYEGGQLDQDVISSATEIDVVVFDNNAGTFQNGDLIRISNKSDIDDTGGQTKFNTINGTPLQLGGNIYRITLTNPVGLSFLAANTRVQSVLEIGDALAEVLNVVETIVSTGDFDETEVVLDNRSTITDSWLITFTSPTDFNVAGTVTGSVGSGSTGSTFTPTNPDFGLPYFTIPPAAWSGIFTLGDTVAFDTSPAVAPVWCRREIPAGAASISGNKAILVWEGESQ